MIIEGNFYTELMDRNGKVYNVGEDELVKAVAICLKDLRKYKGYTLKQVADGTGIPVATVARYENGENTPSVVQAFKFSCFYKISLNDIFLAGYLSEDEREEFFEKI